MWQLLTGPMTQILIALHFSEQLQGYYVAFLSALAIQLFVELGLHGVLINVASHEWKGVHFERGALVGEEQNRQRIVSLARQSFRWYVIASVIFSLLSIVGGLWFFGVEAERLSPGNEEISWRLVWVILVVLNAGHLALMPLTSILEGCHQLGTINRIRFAQAIAGTLLVWGLMVTHTGLWALAGTAAVRLLGEFYIVAVCYRGFLTSSISVPNDDNAGEPLDWKLEIAPLQWRMALQGPLNWLANHLGVLVVFNNSKAEAGRLGLTLTIMMSLAAASAAWMETRRPVFGQLISQHRFEDLDRLFFRGVGATMTVLITAVLMFCGVVYLLNIYDCWVFSKWAGRMLPTRDCGILGVGVIFHQASQCANIYVRSHKKEPFLPVAIVVNSAAAGLIFMLGWRYGASGYAIAYTIIQASLQLPCSIAIWLYSRQHWQNRP